MENSLSIIVLTRNEENSIVDCLESASFADELIVIDDLSTDRTIDIAKRFTKNVFSHSLNGNFAQQRNFALGKAHGKWVLFLDCDERITPLLKQEILKVIKNNNNAFYSIKRVDYMWGKKILHGEGGAIKLVRLARKNSGKWHGKVHEVWRTQGRRVELENALIHLPHASVGEFIDDVDYYSSLRATELQEEHVKSSFLSVLCYPIAKFVLNYSLKKGYKDGTQGFLYALIMSFHSFLVRAKLYQLTHS